ncbi:MAG: hypothetical protein ACKVQK_17400 [Burkholderiales bacterium]
MGTPAGGVKRSHWVPLLALIWVLLVACGEKFEEKDFIGKWRSSKLTTPIYLHANGSWEIKTDDGAVLQFGVWRIKDKSIVWTYKVDARVGHDGDPILSSTPREFSVRENDGAITTFVKLD